MTESNQAPVLTETSQDSSGDHYLTRWMCNPPAQGIKFTVLREEWTDDYTVRFIYEVRVD